MWEYREGVHSCLGLMDGLIVCGYGIGFLNGCGILGYQRRAGLHWKVQIEMWEEGRINVCGIIEGR